ncbi:MAG TPA: NAD(P)/FAD-dependent oxidoreductase [Candidatus Limnocylindria bacterium]|nr:NAD(P)/FAD-dependent oxidoreductase [Candidatus Limnocylindria bacterium]
MQEPQPEQFDFVVVGAGAAGEAAAHLALDRGASVAVIERELFGGSCAYWACVPSKALLHAAAVHKAGGDFPWRRAAEFRDWNINRKSGDLPDDSGHVRKIEKKGGTAIRGTARLAGPGRVQVEPTDGSPPRTLAASHIVLAVGSRSRVPDIPGLAQVRYWTNRQATTTRQLPRSLLVLGGGPTGVELAQVFARYDVPTTLVDSNPRILTRDHPRNSAELQAALERDGVRILVGQRAVSVAAGHGGDGAHRVELSDGSSVEGHEILLAIGRTYPLDGLGLETIGVEPDEDGRLQPDVTLRIAPDVYLAGDPAGPEMHTHLAHYEGELAARIALGDEVVPDLRAIPRATYTDPETASVGLTVEQALEQGFEVTERTLELAQTAKGYVSQATGHVTIVVDRERGTLLGCFMAGPGVSEAIHEAVLAVKLQVPLHILADTLHAYPTVARVLGTLFAQVAIELAPAD